MKKTNNNPPGWKENPSSWRQRIPLVALAMIGFFIAGYLTLYQIDLIESPWEPFFGRGSEIILKSKVSYILPIPDAALGAIGYLLDAVTGLIGGQKRWRGMPWIVILFGFAMGPLGLVSVLLVILQPVLFSAWCSLCLASAIISVVMISPAMDEVLASFQYLKTEKLAGRSVWRAFWVGSNAPDTTPPAPEGAREIPNTKKNLWLGKGARIFQIGAGLFLMAFPAFAGLEGFEARNLHIFGPLVASFGIMNLWEFMQGVRWTLLAFGIWILVSAFLFYSGGLTILLLSLCGAGLAVSAFLRSPYKPADYAGGWGSLFQKPS